MELKIVEILCQGEHFIAQARLSPSPDVFDLRVKVRMDEEEFVFGDSRLQQQKQQWLDMMHGGVVRLAQDAVAQEVIVRLVSELDKMWPKFLREHKRYAKLKEACE